MKKVLLFIAVTATTIFVSQAQISFGLKAGANLYNFSGDDAGNSDSKIGFNIGGLVNIPFSKTFSVQPELVYSTVSSKRSTGSIDVITNMNYIDIPLMLQYNDPNGFYAEAGPQISFLTSAEVKFKNETEDYYEVYKNTNFSFGIGLGYRFAYGISLGARYFYGMSNIADSENF